MSWRETESRLGLASICRSFIGVRSTRRNGPHGISARVLAERLKLLEARGFIYRNYQPTIPPAVTYGLTDRMKEMDPVLKQMAELGQKWYEQDAESGRLKREDGIVSADQSERKEVGRRQS